MIFSISLQVIRGLVEQGFQHLKLSVGITQQGEEALRASHDVTGSDDEDAHMAFVRYCDHYVQQADDGRCCADLNNH